MRAGEVESKINRTGLAAVQKKGRPVGVVQGNGTKTLREV
jgi:hypothetical protein